MMIFLFVLVVSSFNLKAREFYFELSNEDMGPIADVRNKIFKLEDLPDGNYTQGVYLSYTPNFIDGRKISFFFEQDLFSPSGQAKYSSLAQEGVRAFASYSGLGLHYRVRTIFLLHKVTLFSGIFGPYSFGGEFQNFFHKSFRGKDPYLGWQDQIEGGFVGLLQYNFTIRHNLFCDLLCFEIAPSASFLLGNLNRSSSFGGSLRVGRDLVKDYGPEAYSFLSQGEFLTDAKSFSWNLFLSFFVVDVHYNKVLHGRTLLTKLKTVDPYAETTETAFGFNLVFKKWGSHFRYVLKSKEFKNHSSYGFLRVGLSYHI